MSDFLIDTNVLVYSYDAVDPTKQQRAREVLSDLATSGRASLSVQVLGEFFTIVTRKIALPLTLEDARLTVQDFTASFPVLSLTPATVLQAIDVSQRFQRSYWDGLLIAAARLAGIDHLLSEDMQDGVSYGGVRVLNPFAPNFDLSFLA